MGRIDRAQLDAATFPHRVSIPIRFDDLDLQGHVNNAAVVVLLQEGRVLLNRVADLPAMLAGGLRTMVAAIQVEFAAELQHPGLADIHSGILRLGRTSFTIAQKIEQEGRAAVYGEVVLVMADAHGPVALAGALRDSYASLMLGQQ